MNLYQRLTTRPEQRAGLIEISPTWSNGSETVGGDMRRAYMIQSTVHAAINARSRVFGEARFAFRNRRTGKLTVDHPNLEILNRPWPGGTDTELLVRAEHDASLSGAAVLYRSRQDRLQRLDPRKVEVLSNGRERTGYLHWPNGVGYGNPTPLLNEEVAYWAPLPHPDHHYLGASWVEVVATELRTAIKMTSHAEKFYDHAATPNMFVKVEGKLAPDSATRLREQLDQRYAGVANAYRTIVLDGGADIKPVGLDFVSMDYTNSMNAVESRIASAAGTPPIIIGIQAGLEASTYSNYGMAMRAFADHLIRPNWNSIVASLANIVSVPSGSELWFDDSHVAALRADKTEEAAIQLTMASTIRQYVDAGFTPDSATAAVVNQDPTQLVHTNLFSVQLQPAGTNTDDDGTDDDGGSVFGADV